MMAATVLFRWDGEAMQPANRYAKAAADAEYVIGLAYRMQALEERSAKAHAAYFATVTEAWRNLSDEDSARFPTSDSLLKFVLIKCGFADQRQIVCATNSEAIRLAAIVKGFDEYSVTAVVDCVVTIWTAKSQSYKAMGKKDFLASQAAVRDYLAAMIGVSPTALERSAGQSA